MYSSDNISKRIKEIAKKQNVVIKIMLSECGLGANTMGNMNSGRMPLADNLAKIADYLDCSVDYLLGRTDDPLSHKKEKAPILKIEDEPRYLIKRAGRDGKLIEEYLTADEIEQIKKEFERLPKAEDL